MSSFNFSTRPSFSSKYGNNFDQWLQQEYLPQGFKCNDQDVKLQTRKRWFKKIQFDYKEVFHIFSLIILFVWILSIAVFVLYQLSDCSLVNERKEGITELALTRSRSANMSRSTVAASSAFLRVNRTFNRSSTAVKNASAKRSLSQVSPSLKPSNLVCDLVSMYAIFDFGMATIMVLHLALYLLHIVEMLRNFPWFLVEMVYMTVFVLLLFGLVLALSVTSQLQVILILGIIQFACGLLFILNRFQQYKSGKPPQDLSDDVDGDYIRRLKNVFRPQAASVQEEPQKSSKRFQSEDKHVDMFKSRREDIERKSKVKDNRTGTALRRTFKSKPPREANKRVSKPKTSRISDNLKVALS